jgi:hypothetical protein
MGSSPAGGTEKARDQRGNLIGRRIQCEMTCVENMHFGVRHIATVGFRLRAFK